ncbi:MAG TPA: PAS domain S-box protein [Methanospirillum sp.]|uniref:PAS domain S-box protein n=1 Tax=Methanospirillum sp. TaxID=45200 RepID=UPI002C959233|nr:PAS domain S-box protein [Methanospirillum sp.]HOJ96070.1 PAS domain S-box protein [Methanospirillum sp.]HOL40426.1 PAS domain S-box protein [Methanospirillum sp.]
MYRVLYVDDEPGILELVRMYLESYGTMLVDTCPSAHEAKSLVEKTNYDTIVLDYYMPDGDGIHFLKEVRQGGLNCPIIIYTGRGREEVVIDALNNGADFYLQKSGEPGREFADLYSKVNLAIQKYYAEKRVKETTALLRSTLESTADGILVVDSEGRICAWNRKFVQMWDIPYHLIQAGDYSAILSHILPQIINPNNFFNRTDYQMREGLIPGIDIIELRDGKIYERYSQPQMIDGEIVGKVWSFRDITAKKSAENALRESEERFRLLFEQAPIPYQSLDKNGKILEVNEAWTRLFGYTRDEVIGRTFMTCIPEKSMKDYQSFLHDIAEHGSVYESELIIIHKTGREIPVIMSGKMLIGGFDIGVRSLWTFIDISEKKLIESQKEEALMQIQKNLAELAILNDGVRNPLTVIAGQAELALGERAEPILAQVREIDQMIDQLDQRWHESTKILKYLHRHHGLFLNSPDSDPDSS